MTKKINHVLVVYKRSKYQIYFLDNKNSRKGLEFVSQEKIKYWKEAHDQHLNVLKAVRDELKNRNISYQEIYRSKGINYSLYDLVISVGGDGTFLEAARYLDNQTILGVNSDPLRSKGHFCLATQETLSDVLMQVEGGARTPKSLNRMDILINNIPQKCRALNDILVAHARPAALSQYTLSFSNSQRVEEQKGSGIWISTAAGSSGAILSAKGIKMEITTNELQYMPRELFLHENYKLTGGILAAGTQIKITSQMREGELYLDGSRCRIPFPYHSNVIIQNAATPLRVIL